MRLDSMWMFHIINTNGNATVVQLLCEKLIPSLSEGPCCHALAEPILKTQTWNKSHGLLSHRPWVSKCMFQICQVTECCVWVYVMCLVSVEKRCDCADMCPTPWLAPGPLFHTPLAWLLWAPCIMQQAGATALHDDLQYMPAVCCVCCVTAGEGYLPWLLRISTIECAQTKLQRIVTPV